jgi:hypothetical protein
MLVAKSVEPIAIENPSSHLPRLIQFLLKEFTAVSIPRASYAALRNLTSATILFPFRCKKRPLNSFSDAASSWHRQAGSSNPFQQMAQSMAF